MNDVARAFDGPPAARVSQGVAVELGGAAAHGTPGVLKRERERELALRSMGFVVARYSWDHVTRHPAQVVDELRRLLGI